MENTKLQNAIALQQKGRMTEAEAICRDILSSHADQSDAVCLLGRILQSGGRYDDALRVYDDAIDKDGNLIEPTIERGHLLSRLGRFDEALASYNSALKLRPNDSRVLTNRGAALKSLNRLTEALASVDQALAIKPDFWEAHFNRADVLRMQFRYQEAVEHYDRAIALNGRIASMCFDRGLVLQAMSRFTDAIVSFEQVMSIDPDFPWVRGHWLHCHMKICDWAGLTEAFNKLGADIDAGKKASAPFYYLPTPLTGRQQRRCAEKYSAELYPVVPQSKTVKPVARARLRLGYFSADFRDHPVAHLTAGIFEAHDRKRFELIAFAFGQPSSDMVRKRIEAAFDQFIDVSQKSDFEIAQMSRKLGIDIGIDLMGFTTNSRPGIFAFRAAPAQILYLGYPGTMGAPWMDYMIADRVMIPPEHADNYNERIVYMPGTSFPTDREKEITRSESGRQDLGLPEDGFVFCCFNNPYKIAPIDFDVWMRLLGAVSGSVLWLAGTNEVTRDNLHAEASRRGIAPERLVFKKRTPTIAEHLGELRHGDLFLDTFYYNGHTTTVDALWAGLPVVTRLGETLSGRVAASLLAAVGLPELVADSTEEYESLALELATDPQRLAGLRKRLADNRLTHPLFDTTQYTKHLESAYRTVWRAHVSGRVPKTIDVENSPEAEGMVRRYLQRLFNR